MTLGEAIRQYPEWVALLVALGGLGWQQWQIRNMSRQLKDCNRENRIFLQERIDRQDERIADINRELLKRTDIKE